jgi:acetyl esterase/lipase
MLFYHGKSFLPLRAAQGRKQENGGQRYDLSRGRRLCHHDGVELLGDLYLPKDAKSAPALVAVHGGGWVAGVRGAFQYWGPYLAAR